jgi:hypothetical protein
VASYVVLSWKGIPAIVEARDERDSVSASLSERFQALIDAVAMQQGLSESDAYMEAWERSAPADRPGSAAEVAAAVAQDLEDRFFEFASRAFVRP